MKKIELRILGLSFSQSQVGSYILVLSEIKGNRKLPITIKPNDAQYIAMKIEGLKTPRPMTQDLFKKITEPFGIDIQQIFIHTIAEGVFYVKAIASNLVEDVEIECNIGDAISIALSCACPIFCSEMVMKTSGIYMENDGTMTDESLQKNRETVDPKSMVSIENLEKMLNKAIENEEYEVASKLRDRINEMKENETK